MIRIVCYELGYMGLRVQVRDGGARKVFDVVPGRIYHIKALQIHPQNDLPAGAMSGAPTVGDAYSAIALTTGSRASRAVTTGQLIGGCGSITQMLMPR
jgi:outer membrane lipoprotein SlyB